MEDVFVKCSLDEKALLSLICTKRKDMYRKAKNFGLTHPIVVSCSQELDLLLNKYFERVS